MNVLQITIPGVAPSVNHMYEDKWIRGRKYRVHSKDAEVWMYSVSLLAKQQAKQIGWQMAQKGEKVVVELRIFHPDHKQRDADNMFKALQDALEGVVYEDDRYALPRVMDIQVDKGNPRIEVRCYRLEESA